MLRIRWIAPCLVMAVGAVIRSYTAQDVADIQMPITWISNNLPVAGVSFDPNTPSFVTITTLSTVGLA